MTGVGVIFPGQGSQAIGMGKELAAAFPAASELYDRAEGILGWPLKTVAWTGPEEDLRRTDRTQPALYVSSAAAFAILAELGIEPVIAAGHSVGEYAALYSAGVFDFDTGLRLVKARSEAMHRASVEIPGGMIAFLGMSEAEARPVCDDVARERGGRVEVANLNSPGQVVISGDNRSLDLAERLARMRGSLKCIRLKVAGAWHSSLMKGAEDALAPIIEATPFNNARIPVVVNRTGEALTDAAALKSNLIRQVTSAVRWSDSVVTMLGKGVEFFIEAGNGNVLSGLMKRIDRRAKAVTLGNAADAERLRATLKAA